METVQQLVPEKPIQAKDKSQMQCCPLFEHVGQDTYFADVRSNLQMQCCPLFEHVGQDVYFADVQNAVCKVEQTNIFHFLLFTRWQLAQNYYLPVCH